MNDESPKVLRMPMPNSRRYIVEMDGEWGRNTLIALSEIKPETEAARIEPGPQGHKSAVRSIHHLGRRYGFKVCCRSTRSGDILVWVKKPGIDKNILKLWSP